jgi:hypothetical protein
MSATLQDMTAAFGLLQRTSPLGIYAPITVSAGELQFPGTLTSISQSDRASLEALGWAFDETLYGNTGGWKWAAEA